MSNPGNFYIVMGLESMYSDPLNLITYIIITIVLILLTYW